MDYNKYDCKDLQEFVFYDAFLNNVDITPACNLFHYTTFDNYPKIVKSNSIKLRLSRISTFEDECEGIYESFYKVCEKCLTQNIIDKRFYDIILAVVKESRYRLWEYKKLYIACFSKNESNQYLMNNYALKDGKDGLIIGLQYLSLDDLTYTSNNSNKDTGIYLYDVIYDSEKQQKDLEQLIRTIYELKDQDKEDHSLIKAIVTNRLLLHCAVYKNEIYTPEEETRVIVDFDKAKENPKISLYKKNDNYIYLDLDKCKSLYFIKHLNKTGEVEIFNC